MAFRPFDILMRPKKSLLLPLYIESSDINSVNWDSITFDTSIPPELYFPRTLEDLKNVTLACVMAYIEDRATNGRGLGKEYLKEDIIVRKPRKSDEGFLGAIAFHTSRNSENVIYCYKFIAFGYPPDLRLHENTFVVASSYFEKGSPYIFVTESMEKKLQKNGYKDYIDYLKRNRYELVAYVERIPSKSLL